MKILQLCNKPPYPAIDGGCIAMKNVSLGLLNNAVDLKIISISTLKHPFLLENFPKGFVNQTNIEAVFIDTTVNAFDALLSLITSDCYNVSRFFSANLNIKIERQ